MRERPGIRAAKIWIALIARARYLSAKTPAIHAIATPANIAGVLRST
jgi:hypothetical protein